MTCRSRFRIDATQGAVQCLAPPAGAHHFEGLSFSRSGNLLGVAALRSNTVFLYRKRADGRFEAVPHQGLGGAKWEDTFPHDVAFSTGRNELLAVAKRAGVISIFEKRRSDGRYGSEPAFEICGSESRLSFSDGVAFVPPGNGYLAVSNLTTCSISFYRRTSRSPVVFGLEPAFELAHPSLVNPDGLGFSRCGRWLAVANHGNHSVSIFQRRNWFRVGYQLQYEPEPVQVINDPGLRHPHSVAFTPRTSHLIVTNSGANYFSIYEPKSGYFTKRWSESPLLQQPYGPDDVFTKINSVNPMEGGPKGIAIHERAIAVSSPEQGIKVFPFRER